MQVLAVTEEVVLNTNRFFRSYPKAPAGTEVGVDKLLIDVFGEARLLSEALKKKAETGCNPSASEVREEVDGKPTGVLFSREENIVAWQHSPVRLGRVSSKLLGSGLFTHEEAEVLPAQLKLLQEQKPTKQHFRFAVVNGFGSNLGDNTIGITAFRVVAEYMERQFKTFSVDILFGPDTNPANADIVGYEPWVDQVLFQGPFLVDFAQYDAYFDVSGLITLPKFSEMPAVDWYLWWFGLDAKQVQPEKKRNKGYIRWDSWKSVHDLLKEISGKKIFFNPKASVPLRSMPADVATTFAKRLLELDPEMKLIVDQPIDLKHKRLIDLSGKIDSAEKFKALIAQVDGLISVDSFAPQFADAASTPCAHLCATMSADFYPYYPLSKVIELPGLQRLPCYRKFKTSDDEWQNVKDDYLEAWQQIDPKTVLEALAIATLQAKKIADASPNLQLISKLHKDNCIEASGRIMRLKRQRSSQEFERSQSRLSQLATSVLKPGMTSVLAGAGLPTLALNLAEQVGGQGKVHIFEPRRILGQLLSGSLVQAGFFNAIVHDRLPVGGVRKANFPDLTPWSESLADEWGNCISLVSVDTVAIDALGLEYCQAIIIQPPMPFLKVIEGALDTLKRCRPLILISPIRKEEAGSVCKAGISAGYTFWAEPVLRGGDISKMLLLGIPSEQDIAIKGFIKIEVNE